MYGNLNYYKENVEITNRLSPCPECKCKAKGYENVVDSNVTLVEIDCTNGNCGRRLLKAMVVDIKDKDLNKMIEDWNVSVNE